MSRALLVAAILLPSALVGPGCQPPEESEEELVSFGRGDEEMPALPDCASPLFRAIADATKPVLDRGTVPARYALTTRSVVDETALTDPALIYAEMRRHVLEADFEVDLQTVDFEVRSEGAKIVLAALKELERAREGTGAEVAVKVRFLLDTSEVGPQGGPFLAEVVAATRRAVADLELDPRLVDVEVAAHLRNPAASLHATTLVVDGRTALLTGLSMSDRHPATGDEQAAFVLHGDAALSLLAEFDDAWGKSGAQPMLGHRVDFNPVPEACTPMLVAGRGWRDQRQDGTLDHPQARAFLAGLHAATERVRIRTPVLGITAVKKSIIVAITANSKVRVDVLLSRDAGDGENERTIDELYASLAELEVEDVCERLRIRWLADTQSGDVKYASFDGRVAFIGSASMDERSWTSSREVNVVVDDPTAVEGWDDDLFAPAFALAQPVDSCVP